MDRCRTPLAALGFALLIRATAIANPATVGATNFHEILGGSVTGDLCFLQQNGAAICAFQFSNSAPCAFVVVARGAPVGGSWPELKIRFDENEIYKTKVSSGEWATYTFASAVAAGAHAVSVCFENDDGAHGQDQSLCFSSLTIVPAEQADDPVPLSAAAYRQFLNDQRDVMAREADEQIEKIRKGKLVVKVVDSQGGPVSNALVSVAQLRHEFLFGAALSTDLFGPEATNSEAVVYRSHVKKYFNHASTKNALQWPDMEPKEDEVHYELVDAMAGWCQTHGIVLRGHGLFGGCHVPEWAKALSDVELRFAIMRRARNVVGRYRGLIDEFDVNHEALHCAYLNDRLGDSMFRQLCAEAFGANPNAALYLNDDGIIEGNELKRYAKQIRRLLAAGAPIGGIGLQARMNGPVNVARLRNALKTLAQFNLPIKITELDCVADDEAAQAQALEDIYRTAFAHSAVEGILLGGFWEKRQEKPKAALFRADFSKKPAAETYERLVFSNWWTRAEGRTAVDGTFACRAFFGDLQVNVKTDDGAQAQRKSTLKKSQGKAFVEFQLAKQPVLKPKAEEKKTEEPKPAESSKREPTAAPFDDDKPLAW